ncbi:N-acetyltransferase 9 [Podila epigama]|nr:N-acetyltransferase 9 [Podila epigama]
MRTNERTALVGEKSLLVPYLKRHVDQYNKWMQSPELLEMVGDVNLFFNDHDDPHSAEIEIMIAEPAYRRKGMGLEAIRMMITYAYQSLGTKRITAKISTENKSSIQLFLTRLGFVQISYSQIFEEVTLERNLLPADGQGQEGKSDAHALDDMLQARYETLELDAKNLDH